jgi:hypothetical protein
MEVHYDTSNDQFCFRSEGEEDWECFPAVMCEVEGQTRKWYPIGASGWSGLRTTQDNHI